MHEQWTWVPPEVAEPPVSARAAISPSGDAATAPDRVLTSTARTADLSAWLLLLVALSLGFVFLGARGLWEPDEGRYSAIALHMIDSGDYLVPRLNAELPHFAKPPLTYWAIAASLYTFGHDEWAVRFPSALAFVLTALVVVLLGDALGIRRPRMAATLWCTTLLPFVAASLVTADMLLTLFESAAMLGYIRLRRHDDRQGLWLMWLSFGLAFMTKGSPALLPLLALLSFEATRDGGSRLCRLFAIAPVLAFLALALWWFAYVVWRDPTRLRYFLVDETLLRVASGVHDRNPGTRMIHARVSSRRAPSSRSCLCRAPGASSARSPDAHCRYPFPWARFGASNYSRSNPPIGSHRRDSEPRRRLTYDFAPAYVNAVRLRSRRSPLSDRVPPSDTM